MDKWKVPRGSGTHVLMDGGILMVPQEETQEFHQAYVQAINFGSKLFVVEQKTDRFKFFVDLDYKAPEKLSDEDLLQFCSIIHESLGGDNISECLVAKARPRPVGSGSPPGEDGKASTLIKSGVHIHWPRLIVSRTEAINLRSKLIQALGEGPWDTVIDASVYGGSGLRMLWSHKKPAGDPYIPWRQLNSTREFSKIPSVEIVELFSIRTDIDNTVSQQTDIEISGIEEYIQKYLTGQEKARIKRVHRHDHDGWYVQTDSKYCENIRREHKSNHAWFSIHSGRISQRCFDKDTCNEFHGREHILPPSIVEQLNDVAVVGSPSLTFLMDFLPDGTKNPVQEVRAHGPSVLGPGPSQLAAFFGQSPRVRTVGFKTA